MEASLYITMWYLLNKKVPHGSGTYKFALRIFRGLQDMLSLLKFFDKVKKFKELQLFYIYKEQFAI